MIARVLAAIAAVAATGALAGCASTPSVQRADAATPGAPAGHGRALVLRRAAIERLGLQTITLDEPFKRRRMSFRAVPLRTLVDRTQPAPGASVLHAVALNDYVVDIPLSVARGDGVYLATRTGDGRPIPVAEGGPLRVVFLDGASGHDDEDYWIWSVSTAAVR